MLSIHIPGRSDLRLEVLVLDYNGTLALDGKMSERVKEHIVRLAEYFEVHVLTSDTFGSVAQQCRALPVRVKVLASSNHTEEKAQYLEQFNPRQVVAVGNGANDQLMLKRAEVGIAVIGPEGCAVEALLSADVIVHSITEALGLLLNPKRLVATLRR